MCPVSINVAAAACIPLVPFHVVRGRSNVAMIVRYTITKRLGSQFQIAGETVVQLRNDRPQNKSIIRNVIQRIKAGSFKASDKIDGVKDATLRTYISRLKTFGAVRVDQDGTVIWCDDSVISDAVRFGSKGSIKEATR
jgi:hypothetical protein